MGKGKGGVDGFVSRIDVFGSLFLLRGVSLICAAKIGKQVQKKLNACISVLSIRVYHVEVPVYTSIALPTYNFHRTGATLIRDIS